MLDGGQALTAIATENNLTGEGNLQVIITPPIRIPIPVISDGDVARICFEVQPGANPGCQEASNVSFAPGGVDMGDDLGRNLTLDPPTDGGVCVSCVPPIAPVCVPEPAASLQHAAALAAIALLRRPPLGVGLPRFRRHLHYAASGVRTVWALRACGRICLDMIRLRCPSVRTASRI